MPRFIHDLSEARDLFTAVAGEKGLDPFVVEKDYWIMHSLWGLKHQQFRFEMKGGTSLSKGWCCIERFSEDIDVRFDSPSELNIKGDKQNHRIARRDFFDQLAQQISIPGMEVIRDRDYDDEKARNGGIRLIYNSYFHEIEGVKPGVLLEVGFEATAPNEAKDCTSWALEKASTSGLEHFDNRASEIKCFNPEYTFVDKLQTICRYFRQFSDEGRQPRMFLRHYYDLYRLLDLDRVNGFIGTPEYESYKTYKLKGKDLATFKTLEPFQIQDSQTYQIFQREFGFLDGLFWSPGPEFEEVVNVIRAHSEKF